MSESKTFEPTLRISTDRRANQNLLAFAKSEAGQRIIASLNEKRFRTSDSDLTYRVVNYWERAGMLLDSREDDSRWRRYSTLDLVWISIVRDMRAFGFAAVSIEQMKSSLFAGRLFETEKPHGVLYKPQMEYYTYRALTDKKPSFIVVFPFGNASIVEGGHYWKNITENFLDQHIHINLNAAIQRLYPEWDLRPVWREENDVPAVAPDDHEGLVLLYTRNYDKITVHFKNGKATTLEAEEVISDTKKITDILAKSDHLDVEIKKRDGNVVLIKRKILKRL